MFIGTGFPLGTPATTATGLSFGLGSQASTTKPSVSFGATTTTAAPLQGADTSLLNFSTAKTTPTTGFAFAGLFTQMVHDKQSVNYTYWMSKRSEL